MRKTTLILSAFLASSAVLHAQGVATRVRGTVDRDLLTALVAVEDSRDTVVRPTDPRRRGLASTNPFLRAFTVRGLGRLERASLTTLILPALDDSVPEVRAAAADAAAQAVSHASPAIVRAALIKRLAGEPDPRVRAALLESVGRLPQGSAEQFKTTAAMLTPSLSASSTERRGAIRGLFILSRKPEGRSAGAMPADATDRVFTLLADNTPDLAAADRVDLAGILVNAGALDTARVRRLMTNADPYVRDRAVAGLQRVTDTAFVRDLLATAMKDGAPIVRYRAVGIYARKVRAIDGCAPLVRLAHDGDLTVALAAIDATSGCKGDAAAIRLADSIASSFRNGEAWHAPTHAFVALASLDAVRARAQLPVFAQADNLFARMYADTAARLMRDTVALYRLARDPEPNVRTSAIAGLSAFVGHAADSVYLRALRSDDNQLLMAASSALARRPVPTDSAARRALGNTWSRLRASGRETAFDGIKAVYDAWVSLGGGPAQPVANPYAVAAPKVAAPAYAELASMEQSEARIEMADGAVIRVHFFPFEAPTNTARFFRLARAGVFDGLTFHRVVPFFVVQGPSPDANEYSAPDVAFARDELGHDNARGTIGLSTRGRDTADGQIYVNTVDNTWLDHEYSVMGVITSGLETFDRMQEGARIRRIVIVPAK